MTGFEMSRSVPFGAVKIYQIVLFIQGASAKLAIWNKARKTRNELYRLSDRQLSDIGLIRSDIERL